MTKIIQNNYDTSQHCEDIKILNGQVSPSLPTNLFVKMRLCIKFCGNQPQGGAIVSKFTFFCNNSVSMHAKWYNHLHHLYFSISGYPKLLWSNRFVHTPWEEDAVPSTLDLKGCCYIAKIIWSHSHHHILSN